MGLVDRIHEGYVHGRRTEVLARELAALIPARARVLDAGCGDGLIGKLIQDARADVRVTGIDTLLRPRTHIPVAAYDGQRFPHADGSFDAVLFVDVLHHTPDPARLLREASRVCDDSGVVLLKDHTRDGVLAGPTLHLMDWVGNARHGVSIPANYWPERRWRAELTRLGLTVRHWSRDVGIYPWWASWIFGRSLHFIASLGPAPGDERVVG